MWTETTFDLTRREIRTSRPFDQVVAPFFKSLVCPSSTSGGLSCG
jgi:hypothetical protein